MGKTFYEKSKSVNWFLSIFNELSKMAEKLQKFDKQFAKTCYNVLVKKRLRLSGKRPGQQSEKENGLWKEKPPCFEKHWRGFWA